MSTRTFNEKAKAVVILEDGTAFFGKSIGKLNYTLGEICFNTGMTGYQEIFTDPSYFGQIMVTTNAHIGNYGVNSDESESETVQISGLVCKNFSLNPSRVNSDDSLKSFLEQFRLQGISDVDTRALVRHIRKHGAMNAIIGNLDLGIDVLKEKLANHPNMKGLELASKVSTSKTYNLGESNSGPKIAVLDLGCKTNILKHLVKRDAQLTVFPYNVSLDDILKLQPDAIFVSNGPGDPEPLTEVTQLVRSVLDKKIPLFGICLGHQILAQAIGISTYKMHNGHRGINHPVKNLQTGKSEITSQNHGFAIDKQQTQKNPNVEVTHIHLNDQTIAGIKLKNKKAFSVQYHPEAGPGPNDATYLFDDFLQMIK